MNNQTDQTKLIQLQYSIRARKGLIGVGEKFSVALHSCGKPVYTGTDRWGQEQARVWSGVTYLVCGSDHIVALISDGTLRASGRCPVDESALSMISCVRTVATGQNHMAVLLGNGRTVALGSNRYGQCNTANWPTVRDLVCGRNFTIGITRSGQMYIVGGSRPLRYMVRSWKNVAGIFTDDTGTNIFAITGEGRLLSNIPLPPRVAKWRNLVWVAVHKNQIWAVTSGGRILSTSPLVEDMNPDKQYVSCAVSADHVVALTRDGQLLSVGRNDYGQCNTARLGPLYGDFEEFLTDRHGWIVGMMALERNYQIRMAGALRYKSRIACGSRITVCINAEGRVLTTAEFPESHDWSHVRRIACGNAHVLALHENGLVSAAGNNVDGCTDVSHWRNIKSVAAGKYHSLGLTEEGTVLFTGRNDQGQGDVTEWEGIKRLFTTDTYTVGVTFHGQLRLAGTPPFDPALVDASWSHPTDVVAVSTHLVCLYADGTVKTTSPDMQTEDWRGVRAIAAGRDLTLGLCYGGRVLATGKNHVGQCNTAHWRHVVDIGCGEDYAAGLTADGRMLVAGDSHTESNGGKLLLRKSETERWQGIMAFQCGPRHLVALNESGQILSCGEDEDGQCSATTHFVIFRDARQLYGYGQYSRRLEQEIQAHRATQAQAEDRAPDPLTLLPPAEAAQYMRGKFAVGMAHTVLLDEQGTVKACGANDCGQCDLVAFETATRVAAGPYRSAVILSDGRIIISGRNSDGQGDAQSLNRELEPVAPPTFDIYGTPSPVTGTAASVSPDGQPDADIPVTEIWTRVACGHSHTVALRSDGRVFAVGANPDGRCDTSRWSDVAEICCGIRHTVACMHDGTCVATGDNRYGQCDVAPWQNVRVVAAGEFHTAALLDDGRVVAVGDNRKGQCRVEDLTDIISIACLPEATLCVRSDGRVIIRGGNRELDLAVDALRHIVAVEACEHRIAAVTANREMILIPS